MVVKKLSENILNFIKSHSSGVEESLIISSFSDLDRVEIFKILNELKSQNSIRLINTRNLNLYQALDSSGINHESLILNAIRNSGTKGIWLKDLKFKTNIPQTLLTKMLKSLENNNTIKSIKSIKNNRKMYVMYEETPDEEMTGGIWYEDSDIDTSFISNLINVIYKILEKKSGTDKLPRISELLSVDELKQIIIKSNLIETHANKFNINVLIDVMKADGLVNTITVNNKTFLRALKKEFFYEKKILNQNN